MKNKIRIFKILMISLGLPLVSCTTEDSRVKSAAIEEAQRTLQLEVKTEADEKISGKDLLKATYITKIIDRSEFEVKDLSRSETSAKVVVLVRTVPAKVREALTDIIAKMSSNQSTNFNVPDAMGMVFQQLNLNSDERMEKTLTILLSKDEVWKAQPRPAQ